MKITPLKFNISFRGPKDENQPLSPELRAVFADKSIPKSKQKLLWELSEVPDFYKASKNLKTDEFIRLADFVQEQDTNILEMALKGDVTIVQKDSEIETDGHPFFTFAPLVNKQNETPKGVFEFIKEHPIFKIIKDVMAKHDEANIYPNAMPYKLEKDENGNTVFTPVNFFEANINMIINKRFTGKALENNDAVIIFKEKIKGKNDFQIEYKPINPEEIEAPYPVDPKSLKAFDYLHDVDSEIINSLSELKKIPYFRNLVNSTHPMILSLIVGINIGTNGLLAKMLKGEVTLGFFEPETNKEFQRPVVDIGKLLLDRKNNKFTSNDLYTMLTEGTMAREICTLYSSLKDVLPNEKFKFITLAKTDEGILQKLVTNSNEIKTLMMPDNQPIAQKFSEILNKAPLKQFVINFNEK